MGWADIFRPFRRPPPPVQQKSPHDSAEDWVSGDQAECVSTGWYQVGTDTANAPGPVFGEVRIVRKVVRTHVLPGTPDVTFLQFDRWPGIYIATAFRKIRPQADAAIMADAAFCRDWRRAPLETEAV